MKKKNFSIFLMAFLILVFMGGCSNSEEPESTPTEKIGIAGNYAGTMTFSKVEIVYDTDEDENGQETRHYYPSEEASDWLGETVDVEYQVLVHEDNTVTLKAKDEGEDSTTIVGSYDESKNEFTYTTEEMDGENVMTLLFSQADGVVTAKGAMVFIHTETGLVNEITIDLKKI